MAKQSIIYLNMLALVVMCQLCYIPRIKGMGSTIETIGTPLRYNSVLMRYLRAFDEKLNSSRRPTQVDMQIMAFLLNELSKNKQSFHEKSPQYWHSRQGR